MSLFDFLPRELEIANHAFSNLLTECLFIARQYGALLATALESLVLTLRPLASTEYAVWSSATKSPEPQTRGSCDVE